MLNSAWERSSKGIVHGASAKAAQRKQSDQLRRGVLAGILSGVAVGIVAAVPLGAYAQNAQGTILGHVVDSTGAIVPGARVTVTNTNTGVANTLVTNAGGDYVVPQLNPGEYTVSLAMNGFTTQTSSQLTLEVAQSVRQDFSLKVGSEATQVSVTADTQMLQTEDATVGQVISGSLMQALPMNGRDFTNLMLTNIGTNITPGGSGQDFGYHGLNTAYTEVSADGTQAQSTSYSIDGLYDADFFFSVPINIPNELAVQEFKMMNGMYGAQYGQGSTQVNVAIKSGTNQLHGAAYETLQAAFLEPSSPYQAAENAATGTTSPLNPPFHQDQFGGTLSGPFYRNKIFWFGSYDEGLYSKVSTPTTAFVPSPAELGGDFSAYPFPIYNPATTVPNPNYNPNATTGPDASPVIRTPFAGNIIPASQLDPIAQRLAAFYPAPNIPSCTETQHLLSGCSNYSENTKTTRKQGVGTARIDFFLREPDHVFLTANLGSLSQTQTSIAYGQGSQTYARPKLFGGTWTHTFSQNTLNQTTLGYGRDHYFTGPSTAYGPNLSAVAGLANTVPNPATYDLPQLNFTPSNYQSIGGGEPTTYLDDIYQGVDTVTLIRGRHTLNFGIDFRRIQLYELDNYLGTGSLSFNGEYTSLVPSSAGNPVATNGQYTNTAPYQGNAFADLLLGDTSTASGPPPLGTDNYNLWGNNTNLYFQDDVRATDRLTLNAGLRWERPSNFHSTKNDGFAFSTANGGQFLWANCSFTTPILAAGGNPHYLGCGASNTLVPVDNKDFAPRFGFAYRPEGLNEKFVVRGGFGLFYDTYNRYYDGTQFDKDLIYSETAAVYTPPTGNETQSSAVVRNLWSAPTSAAATFALPSYQFSYNQVNWPGNHNPYNEQWNFDTEYSLTQTLLLDVGYVGSHGVRQPAYNIIGAAAPPRVAGDVCNNLADSSLATGANAYCLTDPNFQPVDTREPYPNMPPYLYANENGYSTSYNALQVQLIERSLHGLVYHLNYTYSKTMDITSGINNIYGEPSLIQDNRNPGAMYGLSASNEKHRFVATYAYEVPHHAFHSGLLNLVAGGWTTSGVYQLASGFPFSVTGSESADQEALIYGSRFLANSTYRRTPGFKRTLGEYFDTSEYSNPELGTYGNTNKSPETTPYYTNWDASFGKTTHIFERQSVLFRAEYFNLGSTWHSNTLSLFPQASVNSSTFGSLINPSYGNVSLFNPHTLQLTAQYTF